MKKGLKKNEKPKLKKEPTLVSKPDTKGKEKKALISKPIKPGKTKKKETFIRKVWTFLKEVKYEMTKVRWPNKKEMLVYSSATITFILIFAAFFALTDLTIAGIKMLVK